MNIGVQEKARNESCVQPARRNPRAGIFMGGDRCETYIISSRTGPVIVNVKI